MLGEFRVIMNAQTESRAQGNEFVWKWQRQTARWLRLDATVRTTCKLPVLYLLVYFWLIVLWHSFIFLSIVKTICGEKKMWLSREKFAVMVASS